MKEEGKERGRVGRRRGVREEVERGKGGKGREGGRAGVREGGWMIEAKMRRKTQTKEEEEDEKPRGHRNDVSQTRHVGRIPDRLRNLMQNAHVD